MLGDVQDLCCSEMDDDDGNFWERHAIFAGDGGGNLTQSSVCQVINF